LETISAALGILTGDEAVTAPFAPLFRIALLFLAIVRPPCP